MVAPLDVFVEDVKGYTWIGVAQTVQEAKSLALKQPKASVIKNIVVYSSVSQTKVVVTINDDGSVVQEDDALGA